MCDKLTPELKEAIRHAVKDAIADEVKTATEKALGDTFKLFGVDIGNTESVNKFRADLIHARSVRVISTRVAVSVFIAICVAAVLGLGKLIVWGAQIAMRGVS